MHADPGISAPVGCVYNMYVDLSHLGMLIEVAVLTAHAQSQTSLI